MSAVAMGKMKSKLLAFTLTMPGKGSWNGQWSGEGKLYCKVKLISMQHPLLRGEMPKDFRYRWDDGWEANIHVEVVDGNKARRLRKNSAGFMQYDWMVGSILRYGEIKVDKLREETNEIQTPRNQEEATGSNYPGTTL